MSYAFASQRNLANIPGSYLLPVATTTSLGGIKIDTTSILITSGTISASIGNSSVAGILRPDGTSVIVVAQSGLISIPTGTTSLLGILRPDTTSIYVTSGIVSVPLGTTVISGIVKADGSSIYVTSGTISVPIGTQNLWGILRPDGTSVLVTSGVISANLQGILATTSTLGVVRADGTSVLITTSAVISVRVGTSSTLGIVKTDGTSIYVTSGTISVPLQTTVIYGLSRADGTSIYTTAGTISVPLATASIAGITKPDGTSILIAAGTIRLGSLLTLTTRTIQQGSQSIGSMLTSTVSAGGLEVQSAGSGNAAFLSFHKPGNYASYFGIDTDNQFAVGGWSAGSALANFKAGSLGIGTAASGTAGEIRATNNVTAYYSDARLKDFKGTIPNALDKVQTLNGYYFTENALAKELGYNNDNLQVGVSAQEVEAVLPEIVTAAPINAKYKTVYYDKLVPLLIEAIKELSNKVNRLEGK